nr:lipopolysaccharide heptosyltransferase II [Gammaproteobacteria bacterium]
MVMAQSLFKLIKDRSPQGSVDVLAPPWSSPILRQMPEVREAIDLPIGHGVLALGKRRHLARSLRGAQYQQAIVLPRSFKSALVPWWARIPRRTGYLGELRYGLLNDRRTVDQRCLPRTVERYVALGLEPKEPFPETFPLPNLQIDTAASASTLSRLCLTPGNQSVLVLCPGAAYGPAKRWPADYFGAVAQAMLRQGWGVWVLGSQAEQAIAGAVCTAAGSGCVNLSGRTTLEQTLHLLARADGVVTNDSGLMHVAAALNRPVVAVYGSSDPVFTPPLSPRSRIERLGLSCSPCFARECPLGHTRCLQDLRPARVIETLQQLLAQ